MKFKPSRHRLGPESMRLPLIALIDVVLFLLFYFMIAANFAGDESRLSSTLGADAKGGGKGSDLQPQILQVEAASGKVRFRIGDRVMEDRGALLAVLKQLPQRGGVVVKVAGEAPVAWAATALQACKDAGFSKVSYVPTK